MPESAEHWDRVWRTRRADEVSWFERDPARSRRLIVAAASGTGAGIIDVGAGTSRLVDALLDHGFRDVTLLDVSRTALETVRARLGSRASPVTFIAHDVLGWHPRRQYDVWHDRAVFHFLVEPADRDRYARVAARAVRAGGTLILATFAENGPTQCSGLDVCRYAFDELGAIFEPAFAPVAHEQEMHRTPAGGVQPFTWIVLRRNAASPDEGSRYSASMKMHSPGHSSADSTTASS